MEIIKEQSAARLLAVRGRLYELLTHCIPADLIIKVRLLTNCDK
jgi:replication factor C subunit 3/5